jgi:succinate-semialdehyde dehydrogenase/glutarate-semialdehyde dehydrogenase
VVAAQAAKHIKKSTLELGGNDVFVVLDDADLDRAVKIGVQARLNNAGQCVLPPSGLSCTKISLSRF